MKVFLWPTPDSSYSLYLRSSKTVTSFPDLTADVALAPGYNRAIITNLAVEISPNFGKKIPDALAFQATQSKRNIKSANAVQVKPMTTPDLTSLTKSRVLRDWEV